MRRIKLFYWKVILQMAIADLSSANESSAQIAFDTVKYCENKIDDLEYSLLIRSRYREAVKKFGKYPSLHNANEVCRTRRLKTYLDV